MRTLQNRRPGLGSNGSGERQELVVGHVRRNTPSLLLGVFLVLACGFAFVALYVNAGNRVAVLAVAKDVPAGATLSSDDLTTVRISLEPGVRAVSASSKSTVVGQVARVGLTRGALLTPSSYSHGSAIPADRAVVAVALQPGRAPDLVAGDKVSVVIVPSSSGGAISAGSAPSDIPAEVFSVDESRPGGDIEVSLLVAKGQAAAVARAGSNRQVSLVLLSR